MIYGSRTIRLAGVAFALAALSTTGAANAEQEAVTEVVTFHDLDLSSDGDVDRLDGRLRRAVKRVCGWSLVPSVRAHKEHRECSADAWTRIEPQRSFAIARAREGTSGTELAARTRGASIRVATPN